MQGADAHRVDKAEADTEHLGERLEEGVGVALGARGGDERIVLGGLRGWDARVGGTRGEVVRVLVDDVYARVGDILLGEQQRP